MPVIMTSSCLYDGRMGGVPCVLLVWALVVPVCLPSCHAQCLSDRDDLATLPTYHDVYGMVNLALELFKELLKKTPADANFFFSPYSVWNGLVLAYLGAEGSTRREMEEVMAIEDKVTTLKTWWVLERIYKKRQMRSGYNTFALTNQLFVDGRVPLNPCLANILRQHLHTTNFIQYEAAAEMINQYVGEATHGVIPRAVHPEDVQHAILVMVNAAVFRAPWRHRFSANHTTREKFYLTPHNFTPVAMMKVEGVFRTGSSRELGARVLELPYSHDSFSMYVFLPDGDVDAVVARLDSGMFRSAIADIWHHQVTVHLPRFTVNTRIKGELKQALYDMGIRELFSESADLTTLGPRGSLVVSRTLHQAALRVTEEGTEAAAATVFVSLSRTKPAPPKSFVCDRPFVFLIYDSLTSNIVFMGVYRNPA